MQYCYVLVNTVSPISQVNVVDSNAYCNYLQDLYCMKSFGCNFTVYMEQVIDKLCQMQTNGLSTEIVSSQPNSQSIDKGYTNAPSDAIDMSEVVRDGSHQAP